VWPLPGGGEYTIRPIRPDDAQMLQQLVKSLSPQSRYYRFFTSMTELQPQLLARLTLIDYDSAMALVAVHKERQFGADGEPIDTERIIGVSRYTTNPNKQSCEFALVVADDFSGKGLGSRLMLSIMEEARDKGLSAIEGVVMANNTGMLKLMRNLGFAIKPDEDDPACRLVVHPL
jgi:acetyltransferase